MAGYWISIRRRVSDADQKRLTLGMLKGMEMKDGRPSSMQADATQVDLQKMRLWVLKWGKAGEPGTRPTTQELLTLLPEHAAQVLGAIAKHEEDLAAEVEVEALDTDPLLGSGGLSGETDGSFATHEPEPSTLD